MHYIGTKDMILLVESRGLEPKQITASHIMKVYEGKKILCTIYVHVYKL